MAIEWDGLSGDRTTYIVEWADDTGEDYREYTERVDALKLYAELSAVSIFTKVTVWRKKVVTEYLKVKDSSDE